MPAEKEITQVRLRKDLTKCCLASELSHSLEIFDLRGSDTRAGRFGFKVLRAIDSSKGLSQALCRRTDTESLLKLLEEYQRKRQRAQER